MSWKDLWDFVWNKRQVRIEGECAWLSGKPYNKNPYPKDSWKHREWAIGYKGTVKLVVRKR